MLSLFWCMSHITENQKCDYYLCSERYPITLKSLGKYYVFQDFTSASREASWDNWVVSFCLETRILAYAALIGLYQNKGMFLRPAKTARLECITFCSSQSVAFVCCKVNSWEENSSYWRITWKCLFAYQRWWWGWGCDGTRDPSHVFSSSLFSCPQHWGAVSQYSGILWFT